MSREEDLIRSTTRAIASTVREVPPLRLEPAAGELRSPARAPRRPRRGSGHRSRWWSWGAPLTAAAVVVALAIALVLVRDIPNGRVVPKNPATSTGPGAVPRYYVVLKQLAGDVNSNSQRNDIVVGDSLTGKTLATFAPPAHTAFESVTAAADDQTFVVFAVTSSNGEFTVSAKNATLTGSFYEVRLAPGTGDPARLSRLPIQPITVPATVNGYPSVGLDEFIDSFATVLSGSGKELAVPVDTGLGLAVKVFSVATGQLLHDWTTNDRSIAQEPSLTWIDGDRELALESRSQTVHQVGSKYSVSSATTVREWPVAGPASGDLGAVSKVVWDVPAGKGASAALENCTGPVVGGVDVISADGKALSCGTASGWYATESISFLTFPLTISPTAAAKGGTGYRTDYLESPVKAKGSYSPEVLWTSSSGDTLIGAVIPIVGGSVPAANGLHIGVISHGKFTPVRLPSNLLPAGQQLQADQIAF
jgi:hypothetical protein